MAKKDKSVVVVDEVTPAQGFVPTTTDLVTQGGKNGKKGKKGKSKNLQVVGGQGYGAKRCHHSHPALPIVVGEATYYIYGGSCLDPAINDMDIFIGLDHGMSKTHRQYPWHSGTEFLFPIRDMGVPPNLKEFGNLLQYIKNMLEKGKKVFVGCIGGHGRTGLVFAALVNYMTGEVDATTYIREHYCSSVVESSEQVEWLHTHFGIKKVGGSKAHTPAARITYDDRNPWSPTFELKQPRLIPAPQVERPSQVFKPIPNATSIHGGNKIIKG